MSKPFSKFKKSLKFYLDINPVWLFNLKLKNILSKNKKIGFGPLTDLGSRKYHVDPIVNQINKKSNNYTADVFFKTDNLFKFDIIVFVKVINWFDLELIKTLKRQQKILIYNTCDADIKGNPQIQERVALMDGIVVPNPLIQQDIEPFNKKHKFIEAPIIHHHFKKSYNTDEPIIIFWEGYKNNLDMTLDRLTPVIQKLEKSCHHKFNMIFCSNAPEKDKGTIKFIKWKSNQWEKMLIKSDIAVAIKPTDDEVQQRKGPTKVNTYRSVGLPIICTPSESDKRVIEHEKNGYLAYSTEEWFNTLKLLIDDPEKREEIGKAGRKYVLDHNNINKITQEYIDFFNDITSYGSRDNVTL